MKARKSPNKLILRRAEEFHAWDYGYLLEIERECLKSSAKYFTENKLVVDADDIERHIKLAIKLLDIVMEEDSSCNRSDNGEYNSIKYVNIKNRNRFFNHDWEVWNPLLKDHLRQQKAWYLYNKLRTYFMQTFWD